MDMLYILYSIFSSSTLHNRKTRSYLFNQKTARLSNRSNAKAEILDLLVYPPSAPRLARSATIGIPSTA